VGKCNAVGLNPGLTILPTIKSNEVASAHCHAFGSEFGCMHGRSKGERLRVLYVFEHIGISMRCVVAIP